MINKLRMLIFLGLLMSGIVFISGCVSQNRNPEPITTSTVALTPTPAVMLTSTPTSSPTPTTTLKPEFEIKITSPKEGDKVISPVMISGNILGTLPEGRYMWLIVNPQKAPGLWWPQGGGQITPLKGRWDMQATLGGDQDNGTNFKFAVILINEKGNQDYLDYLAKGQQTGSYPGIPFPSSANILDSITVIKQ